MHIRPLEAADLDLLYTLGKQEWPTDAWLTIEYLKVAYEQPNVSFVAVHNAQIIGGIIVVLQDIVPYWIRYLIVDSTMRKQGIGSALLKKVSDKLPKNAALFVDTGAQDEPALQFYKKNNFTTQGIITALYGKEDGVVLRAMI